ncbi:MAG TPA: helix-turn-helix domain-containing protein [Micrococcaceae bacterium]|nr:helix-turn-helix domain-containing protein [Micrococcaceae bacterium]
MVQPAEYLSIKRAAERFGVCECTLRRRISEGLLPAYRFGPRAIRIKASDLENMGKPIPVGEPAATWRAGKRADGTIPAGAVPALAPDGA